MHLDEALEGSGATTGEGNTNGKDGAASMEKGLYHEALTAS